MRTLFVFYFSLALALAASGGAKPSNVDDSDLRAIEHSFREDVQHITLSQLTDLLADEYVSTDSQGNKTDRTKTLELFKTAKGKNIKFPVAKLGDLKVTTSGQTANAVGSYTLDSDGAAEHAFTDAFEKSQKGWQLVSSKEGLK